jgi:hypothetical protein
MRNVRIFACAALAACLAALALPAPSVAADAAAGLAAVSGARHKVIFQVSDIGYVKAGVVELMVKQQQGYAYIRP